MIQIIKNNGRWAVNINGYYHNELSADEATACVISWMFMDRIHSYLSNEEQWKAAYVDKPELFTEWIGDQP